VNWGQFRKGQEVEFYTAAGWKKGHVTAVYDNSCSVTWSAGSTNKTTRIYDDRHIKPA
jgi:hypothetical protein